MADTTTVDASLWWDSFTLLLTELENASLSSDLPLYLVNFHSFHTFSTLRFNLCIYINRFVVFRPISWRKIMLGSWIYFRASNRPIRNPRMLWIQRTWKLDLSCWIFNLTWKIKLCKLAPAWLVASSFLFAYIVSPDDCYYIINFVVIFMVGIRKFTVEQNILCAERKFKLCYDIEIWKIISWLDVILSLLNRQCCF
jgi:hypothetical protein